MRRLRLAAALGLGLAGCAGIDVNELAARPGEYLSERAAANLDRVSENARAAARAGELSRRASFTMEQEFWLGKSVAANVVARLGGEAVPPEHPAARYLRDVGTAVALAAAELRVDEDRPYPLRGYRFLLVRASQVNAVGAPGGFIVVTTGALRAARSEDELAALLAHEVAHVQRGHAVGPVERARRQEHLTTTLLEGTDEVVYAFLSRAVTLGTDFVLDKGYGKVDELAADAFGKDVVAAAGYDPRAPESLLSRLRGKAAQGGFLSRHPPAAERVAALAARAQPADGAAAGAKLRLARFEARAKVE